MLAILSDDVAVDPKKVKGISSCPHWNNGTFERHVRVSLDSDEEEYYMLENTTVAEVAGKINAAIEAEAALRGAK